MSDKDKKAFERWYIEQDEGGVFGNDDTTMRRFDPYTPNHIW